MTGEYCLPFLMHIQRLRPSFIGKFLCQSFFTESVRSGITVLRAGFEAGLEYQLLVSPSSYAVNNLGKLRDVYGWMVSPDFD